MSPTAATDTLKRSLRRAARTVFHAYPFYIGCGRLANSRPMRWLDAPEAVSTARLRSRDQVLVPKGDFVGRALYYFGDLDPKISWILRRALRPGDTVLDIGANLGLVTLQASRLVGKRGTVHAFEPQPRVGELLRRSAALNQASNVHVHQTALGAEPGSLRLWVPEGNLGAASLVRRGGAGRSIDVPVRTLTEMATDLGIGRIRLVKMDVEGFEGEVLEGAVSFLKQAPADAILYEILGAEPFSARATTRILHRLGYRFFVLGRQAWRVGLEPVAADWSGTVSGHDVLAVHGGPAYAEVAGRLDLGP